MKYMSKNPLLNLALMMVLVGLAFMGGIAVGNNEAKAALITTPTTVVDNPVPTVEPTQVQEPATPTATPDGFAKSREELFAPFWQTYEIVLSQYVDQPVDEETMMRGAIRGMLESLGDEHTSYMDPNMYRQSLTQLQGDYEGIGAWVDITGDYLKIVSPMSGNPAEAAGLRPEDLIIAVDGEDMTGIDGNVVLSKVLGPAGTNVTLTIQREGVENFDVTITRAHIVIPSVEGKMIENTNLAYIQLTTFGPNTADDLHAKLIELLAQNPTGLILDLRYNGGGYLNTAVQVLSEFLPAGEVAMYEEFGDGTQRPLRTIEGGLAKDIPMIVLVNDGTASSSEITAGALQDYGRAQLVGIQTFGKGSVQNWIPLTDNAGAVRVTIAHWLTPEKRQINKIGLTPDYLVELTTEDATAKLDPQLDKAIELLGGSIGQ
jgi:carboxyl-terminal processing protease